MKTGDETVGSMFDEITETKIAPDGTAASKRYVTDDETIREMDFAEACDEMVRSEKQWRKLESDPRRDVVAWFDALEARYEADKKLWQLFTAGDRSQRSNKMYNEYRLILLMGSSTRANA
jgi:hypothetical protein